MTPEHCPTCVGPTVTPDWTGSPRHVVAGLLLALACYAFARRRDTRAWVSAVAAVTVTMASEAVLELGEYLQMYGDQATAHSYYDTIADIGTTLVGALAGALLGLAFSALRRLRP